MEFGWGGDHIFMCESLSLLHTFITNIVSVSLFLVSLTQKLCFFLTLARGCSG